MEKYSSIDKIVEESVFSYDNTMEQSFISLKNSMCSTLSLVVQGFTNPFFLECDTSRTGLGAVLTQESRPLSFTRKQLCDHNLGKYTHEKYIMAILHDVDTCKTIPPRELF